MKSLSGEDLARVLERHGWRLLRVQGSHHIYGRAGVEARISIPIHSGAMLKRGLLHHLLQVAGLREDDL